MRNPLITPPTTLIQFGSKGQSCFGVFFIIIGEALNGDIGLSLKDRKICFFLLFYDRTVLFG